MAQKLLILALGNTILSDDGVGIYVGRLVKELLPYPNVELVEATLAGLQLLDYINGYDHLVVIDSIQTSDGVPGQLYYLTETSFKHTVRITSPHDINLFTALELGRRMGMAIPSQVDIYAIEVKDLLTFGEQCTPEVTAAIPQIAVQIVQDLKTRWFGTGAMLAEGNI